MSQALDLLETDNLATLTQHDQGCKWGMHRQLWEAGMSKLRFKG